jgi:hypothetical protein
MPARMLPTALRWLGEVGAVRVGRGDARLRKPGSQRRQGMVKEAARTGVCATQQRQESSIERIGRNACWTMATG